MDMKRDYYEDVQFFASGVIAFWLSILVFGLAIFPFVAKIIMCMWPITWPST